MIPKVKIAIIMTNKYGRDGMSIVANNQITHIDKNIYDITLIIPSDSDKTILTPLLDKIKIIDIISRRKPIKYFLSLNKILSNNNYDVIHIHGNSSSMILEAWAGRKSKIKKIIVHNHTTKGKKSIIEKLITPLFNKSYTNALSCSLSAGNSLYKTSFDVIKNGFILDDYMYNDNNRITMRKENGFTDQNILIGIIGRVSIEKNHEFLFNVFEKLVQLNNNYLLIIVGDGNQVENLKQNNIYIKYSNNIKFFGQRDDLPKIYSTLDILTMPSLFEGFPMVALEGQASGLPTILSNGITQEMKLTNLVQFSDLTVDEWVEVILKTNLRNRETNSKNAIKKLKKEGFHILDEIKNLENIYSK